MRLKVIVLWPWVDSFGSLGLGLLASRNVLESFLTLFRTSVVPESEHQPSTQNSFGSF